MKEQKIRKSLMENFNGNVTMTEFQIGENSCYCIFNANALDGVTTLEKLESSIYDWFCSQLSSYTKVSIQVFGFDRVDVIAFL